MPSKKQNKANDGPKPVVPQQVAPERSFLAALKKDQPAASSTPVVATKPATPQAVTTPQKPAAQNTTTQQKPAPTSVWGKPAVAVAEPVKNVTAKPQEKKPETQQQQQPSKPAATPAQQQAPAASNKSFLDAIKKPKVEEKPKEVKPVVAAAEKPAATDAKVKPDLSVQTPAVPTTTTTTTTTSTDKPAADDSPTSPNQQAGFTTQKTKKGGKLARTGQKIVRDKINIPPGAAAYIIGKAGANIKRINEQSGALAKVNDTIVTIQANDKDTANKAKKMVLELLRAFYARTQIQTNEFNLLMIEEDDHTRLKTQMVAYDGPLSEWLVREQIIKQEPKPAPAATTTDAAATTTTTTITTPAVPETKTAEPAEEEEAPIKRVYFMATVQQDDEVEQEDEDDEEAEILRRMTQKGSSSSNAKKAQEKDQDKSKASQGASLTLVTGKVLKETFSSLADKLTDEKTREDEVRQLFAKKKSDDDEEEEEEQPQQAAASKKTEHNPNTVDVEFILGKKLFYPNIDAKKNKKKLKNLDKIDEMPVKEFLDSKFGFGHQLNTSFNYALRSEEIAKLESVLATKSDFKQSQRQIIVGRVRFNAKKYNITLEVESRLDNNLNTFKIVEFHEKSSRLALIDFIRPYPSWLDFRIISRYYSHTVVPAPIVEFVEKRARWDSNKGEIVLLPEEKKPEEKNDKGEIVKPNKFNLVADRVKKDKVYSNGTYTIVFSATKDALKDQAKQQPKKKEKKEEVKAEENKEGAAATTPAPAPAQQEEDDEDDDMKVDGEKKIIDSLEVAIFTSSLTYANFGDSAANSKALSDSLFWISNEFLGSQ